MCSERGAEVLKVCPRFQPRSAASLDSDEDLQTLDTRSASLEVADALVESLFLEKPFEMIFQRSLLVAVFWNQ
jgi:hypothetical protein